jgi:lysozyme
VLTIIDVSQWQGSIDWKRVAASGVRLAFVKATEGSTFTDPRFAANRHAAEEHGIRIGAYHFASPSGSSPAAQADHFAHVVGTLRRRELRPVVDLETGLPTSTQAFARELVQAIRKRLGVTPLLYSYSAYLAAMHPSRPIGGGLWLASYSRNDGRDYGAAVPKPWKGWVAHQYSSRGHVAGIPGLVDVSHAPKLRPLLAHPVTGRL